MRSLPKSYWSRRSGRGSGWMLYCHSDVAVCVTSRQLAFQAHHEPNPSVLTVSWIKRVLTSCESARSFVAAITFIQVVFVIYKAPDL